MEFITVKEASLRWEVGVGVIRDYCKFGRISGAYKCGNRWLIPTDAEKPKVRCNSSAFFTLPRKCPQIIFTPLYNKPGSADSVAETFGSDLQAKKLYNAQLSYFRGEIESARNSASELLEYTKRQDVRLGCCFVLALCAMYDGDVSLWLYARQNIERTPCQKPQYEALRDFQIANIACGICDENGFPDWLCEGYFDALPLDCFPLARFLYLKYLMITHGDPGVSLLCGPLISQCRAEGALLAEIYCLILTAIGFHDRGNNKNATLLLDAAIEKALPDRLYSPFAEYRGEFGILLDERLNAADKSALASVRELNRRLYSGWGILCRQIRGIKFTDGLTQRERHAAKLAAKGLTNAEIAERMNVSINSVKRYISEIISKTGAPNRTAIANYIALTGETLP